MWQERIIVITRFARGGTRDHYYALLLWVYCSQLELSRAHTLCALHEVYS